MTTAVPIILFALSAWTALVALIAWMVATRFRGGDVAAGAAVRTFQVYARLVHRLRVEGLEHVPARSPEGMGERPLVVVANHTAGVDPILIQAALPFEVRWVMARDMRVERLGWLWDFGRVIFVDRQSGEATGVREALRHLRARMTLGVFPEGSIERPPRMLLPFQAGISMLAGKSGALVLPVIVEGTPQVDPAWASITRRSRSSVRFLPVVDPAKEGIAPDALAEHLRGVFARATRWPLNQFTPRFEDGRWWYFGPDGERFAEEHLAMRV